MWVKLDLTTPNLHFLQVPFRYSHFPFLKLPPAPRAGTTGRYVQHCAYMHSSQSLSKGWLFRLCSSYIVRGAGGAVDDSNDLFILD